MYPRYFATIRRLNEGVVEEAKVEIGRFNDRTAAEAHAQKEYGHYGSEVLAVRVESSVEAVMYRAGRILIRSIRVLVGAAIGVAAYVLLSEAGPGIGDVPISGLTLNMIFRALVHAGLFLAALGLAWMVAFGPGPDSDA